MAVIYMIEVDGKKRIVVSGADWKKVKEVFFKGKKIRLIRTIEEERDGHE